jgi:hypothetical protein
MAISINQKDIVDCRGKEGPKGSKGTLRPDF